MNKSFNSVTIRVYHHGVEVGHAEFKPCDVVRPLKVNRDMVTDDCIYVNFKYSNNKKCMIYALICSSVTKHVRSLCPVYNINTALVVCAVSCGMRKKDEMIFYIILLNYNRMAQMFGY